MSCGHPWLGAPPPHLGRGHRPRLRARRHLGGVGDDPPRYLVVGPDRFGNLLELVVIAVRETELVIHAMALRRSTERELFGGEGR